MPRKSQFHLSKIRTVNLATVNLSIHTLAQPAYLAWQNACPNLQKYETYNLIAQDVLQEALRLLPLPAIRMKNDSSYGVIGRFNLYHAVQVQPDKNLQITLAVIDVNTSIERKFRRLSSAIEAMHILESGYRCKPEQELAAILLAAKNSGGWDALIDRTPSRAKTADRLKTTVHRLRPRKIRVNRSNTK